MVRGMLWLDEKAEWQHDKLYLPDEVDLTKLPANPDGFQPATAKQIIYTRSIYWHRPLICETQTKKRSSLKI